MILIKALVCLTAHDTAEGVGCFSLVPVAVGYWLLYPIPEAMNELVRN